MFDVAPTELLLLGIVALVVIGPKDLPRAMRFVGKWVGRARGMARHFRDGVDEMIRQSELEEMEKKWREENERIMREHPAPAPYHPVAPEALPAPAPDPEALDDAAEAAAARPAVLSTPATPHPPAAAPAPAPAEEPRP
ncbi:MAG: Sec-independent protein translocase protein TatB [Sphingomonas fennica]